MSTFVVRFIRTAPETFRGKVRHVRSGEESVFASPTELLCFFEKMNVAYGDDTLDPSLPESDEVCKESRRDSKPPR